MVLIWYNPDADKYEVGFKKDFHYLTTQSPNQDRFEVLYEFHPSDSSRKVARKIISNLNLARAFAPKPQEIFA